MNILKYVEKLQVGPIPPYELIFIASEKQSCIYFVAAEIDMESKEKGHLAGQFNDLFTQLVDIFWQLSFTEHLTWASFYFYVCMYCMISNLCSLLGISIHLTSEVNK